MNAVTHHPQAQTLGTHSAIYSIYSKAFFHPNLMTDRREMKAVLPPPKESIALVVAAVSSQSLDALNY